MPENIVDEKEKIDECLAEVIMGEEGREEEEEEDSMVEAEDEGRADDVDYGSREGGGGEGS